MFYALVSFFMLTSVYADGIENSRLNSIFKVVPEEKAHTFSGSAAYPEFTRSTIKAVVWNIKKTEEFGWKEEFTTYAKDKDLVLIQEAYQNQLFNSTLALFENFRWDMGISFLIATDRDTATGNMIGSSVQPSYVRVRHTIDREPVVNTPKATTFAKYPLEGTNKELLVISIHGINLTGLETFERHLWQIRYEIEQHNGPILFAGDFNTRTKARTQYLEAYAKDLGLKAVKFENGHCRMRFKFTPYYLDHSYVRDLKIKKAWVDCGSIGSDHKPMFLEFDANT